MNLAAVLIGVLQVALLAVKLAGLAGWPWWVILSPAIFVVLWFVVAFWFYWRCMANGFRLDV